jgi:hypothetical protein
MAGFSQKLLTHQNARNGMGTIDMHFLIEWIKENNFL